MEKGIDYAKTCPQAIEAMWKVEQYVRQCGLEHSLLELVKTRASQING
ncbi:MAG: carboxymuconolactone decarboxylase family protein, partial [Candidatus Omnitrophica bacterium]|nr:carboxymuconolactone decarboxylase family protein [Candidatus Omnitrophota bacterium]